MYKTFSRENFINKHIYLIYMVEDIKLKLKDVDVKEVLDREVSKFGTGCHVIVPQKHEGKRAIVIIKK